MASLGLAVLATSSSSASVHNAIDNHNDNDFSFARWVDAIAMNPQSAMSPQQAVVAFNETLERRMWFCFSFYSLVCWTC